MTLHSIIDLLSGCRSTAPQHISCTRCGTHSKTIVSDEQTDTNMEPTYKLMKYMALFY